MSDKELGQEQEKELEKDPTGLSKEYLQMEKQHREQEKESALQLKTQLETAPEAYISERISKIDTFLVDPGMYKGPPKNPNNITMYQHLQNVKQGLQDNPEKEIAKRITQLTESIERSTQELRDIDDKLSKMDKKDD